MEFNFPGLIYLLILLAFILWQVFSAKKFDKSKYAQLQNELQLAQKVLHESLLSQNKQLSEIPFCEEFKFSFHEYRFGDRKQLPILKDWFSPQGKWIEHVGVEGEELRARIYDLIKVITNK